MRLTPRYSAPPVIALDGDPSAVGPPTIRQLQRLAARLSTLSADEWAHPSRCDGWSTRDVVAHLNSVYRFWSLSIRAGLQGTPTQFLATFDPVATPAQMVDASTETPQEVFAEFVSASDELAEVLGALSASDWNALAEAPPGHISVSALCHHAIWDSWVHERDIFVPLGATDAPLDDEMLVSLRYVAALGPGLALTRGETRRGAFAVKVTEPVAEFVVVVADQSMVVAANDEPVDTTIEGSTIDVLESLSMRRPFSFAVPSDAAWMFNGLATTFDV